LRAKRLLLMILVIISLIVAVSLISTLIGRRRYINTVGCVVFASDQGSPGHDHIFITKRGGGGVVQLTHGAENDSDPSFSPDGSQIVYVSDRSGSPQVWLMDADGQTASAISFGTDTKTLPRFCPDGNHIAYLASGRLTVCDRSGGNTNLILPVPESIHATNSQRLAGAERQAVIDYAWSPTTDFSKSQFAAIQQTPDGDLQTVALISASGGDPNVFIGAPEVTTAWSPDGSQLAIAGLGFQGPQNQSFSGIVMYSPNGQPIAQPPLAATPSASLGPQHPTYAADGTKLAFDLVQQSTVGVDQPSGIGLTAAGPGSAAQMLVRGPVQKPQFSPDDTHLLFLAPSAQDKTQQEVYVVDMSTGVVTPLDGAGGNVEAAQWSPAVAKGK
jgi:Tol biopolymer transport system component